MCVLLLLVGNHPSFAVGYGAGLFSGAKDKSLPTKFDEISVTFSPSLDAALAENITLYLEALTLPNPKRLLQYQSQVNLEVEKALKVLGYYQPAINSTLDFSGTTFTVKLDIKPGEPVRIHQLKFELIGAGASDPAIIALKNLRQLKKGAIFHHGDYEAVKSAFNRLALQRGYFDAHWVTHEVMIDVDTQQADISLIFDLQQRYYFGAIQVSPKETPAFDIIHSTATFYYGQPYNARLLADFSVDLSSSSYFKSVIARPLIAQANERLIPIEVQVVPKANNQFEVSAGYSTDVHFRGKLYWIHPWLNRWGHSIRAGVEGSTNFENSDGEQIYSLTYKIPIEDAVNNYFNIKGSVSRKKLNETDERVISLQGQRLQKLDNNWQRTLFLRWQRDDDRRYQVEATDPDESEAGSALGEMNTITDMIIPGVSYGFNKSEGGLDPYYGYQQLLTFELSDKNLGSIVSMMKGQTRTKWITSLAEKHRFISRIDLGAIVTDDFVSVPSSMRFFTGGAQSIRGFGYETIYPRDSVEDGGLTGGQYLTVGSIEYSYPVSKNWRIATFFDAGTATNDFSEPIKMGTGVGLRWFTPIGPVKFDFAFAISEPGSASDIFKFHFTMGPEL